jgi:hypothetical protein
MRTNSMENTFCGNLQCGILTSRRLDSSFVPTVDVQLCSSIIVFLCDSYSSRPSRIYTYYTFKYIYTYHVQIRKRLLEY